jgi:hypothetical protein
VPHLYEIDKEKFYGSAERPKRWEYLRSEKGLMGAGFSNVANKVVFDISAQDIGFFSFFRAVETQFIYDCHGSLPSLLYLKSRDGVRKSVIMTITVPRNSYGNLTYRFLSVSKNSLFN